MQLIVALVAAAVVFIFLRLTSRSAPSPGVAPPMIYVTPPYGQSGAGLTTPAPGASSGSAPGSTTTGYLEGTPVKVTVDSSGKVISGKISMGGFGVKLSPEALALINGGSSAAPPPPPPPGWGGTQTSSGAGHF